MLKKLQVCFCFRLVCSHRNCSEDTGKETSQQVASGNVLQSADFCFRFRVRFSVAFVLPLSPFSLRLFSLLQLFVVTRCVVLLDVRGWLFVLVRFVFVVGAAALLLIARVRCVSKFTCKFLDDSHLSWHAGVAELIVPTFLCCASCPRCFKSPFTGQVSAVFRFPVLLWINDAVLMSYKQRCVICFF